MTQLFIHLNKGFAHALLRMHPAAEKCRIAMTRLIKAEQQAAHNRKCICVWFYAKHRIFVRSFDKKYWQQLYAWRTKFCIYIPVKRCLIPFNHPSIFLGARRRKAQHIFRWPWPGIIIYSISLSNLHMLLCAWDLYPRIWSIDRSVK
jgi:hypothetical protein